MFFINFLESINNFSCAFSLVKFQFLAYAIVAFIQYRFAASSDFVFSGIYYTCCGVVDKVFLMVFQGYKAITCAFNFNSIKYISSFFIFYSFFISNILDCFCCSFICCSYCIVQEVIVVIFS